MIIGIDGNDANVEQQVGVSVYTRNMLEYFHSQASPGTQFVVFLRNTPLPFLPKESEYYSYQIIASKPLWSQIFLPLHLFTHKNIDVFFAPAHYAPRYSPVPTVVTIHDVAYEYFPQEFLKKDLYKLKNWTKYSITNAKKVIAVSKTTKKDIMKVYGLPDEKIVVVYNGFEKRSLQVKSSILSELQLKEKKYILYIGTLQPRKNIPTLINAFNSFKKDHPEFKLVVAGKKGWLYENIFDLVEELRLKDDVYFPGYVKNEDAAELYKHAYCFVLPSFYEGFGIPLLEAMSYGSPVISSFASSLSEVGGDACIYFDPENVKGLVDDLESLQKESLRRELIEKGYERVKHFSWETCASETLSVIKQAAKTI